MRNRAIRDRKHWLTMAITDRPDADSARAQGYA